MAWLPAPGTPRGREYTQPMRFRSRRLSRLRLRYERIHPDGRVESLERDWLRSWWTQEMFHEMMSDAGFTRIAALDKKGDRAAPDAKHFVFIAQKS